VWGVEEVEEVVLPLGLGVVYHLVVVEVVEVVILVL
jgi:hypothetical protein